MKQITSSGDFDMSNLIDKEQVPIRQETKRRTLVKSVLWRFIGVVWTWIGAYFIMLLVPPTYNTAALIATFIVIYHHSTRMIMYYFYERVWNSIPWGKKDNAAPMKKRYILFWIMGIVLSILFVFLLILYVTPLIKGK